MTFHVKLRTDRSEGAYLMDFFTMLTRFIFLMSHVSLGVGNMTYHSLQLLELR